MSDAVALQNRANSCEVNWGPLSLTNCSGIPNCAKSLRSVLIVCVAVVVDIGITSGHLLCASTTMSHICPRN